MELLPEEAGQRKSMSCSQRGWLVQDLASNSKQAVRNKSFLPTCSSFDLLQIDQVHWGLAPGQEHRFQSSRG